MTSSQCFRKKTLRSLSITGDAQMKLQGVPDGESTAR
jgi:hypothetical protein